MESSRQATNPNSRLRLSSSFSPERGSPSLQTHPRRPLFTSSTINDDPTRMDPQAQPDNQIEENPSHQL